MAIATAEEDTGRIPQDDRAVDPACEGGVEAIPSKIPQQATANRGPPDTFESIHSDLSSDPKAESTMLEDNITTSFDPLRRRTSVWWLLALYLPLLVLPWVLTCIMSYRPLTAPRYIDPTGHIRPRDFDLNEGWQVAINVMNSITAVLTIPVTSLIIAEASVVYLQRDGGRESPVPLAHFFDIADRGWTDIPTVWRSLPHENSSINAFIVKSAAFVVLCAIILPLQQLLVRTENIQIITCNHVPYGSVCSSSDYIAKSSDAQVGRMNALPLWNVKEQVQAHLASDNGLEQQPHIWSLANDSLSTRYLSNGGYYASPFGDPTSYYDLHWISAVPNGTSTGVLPQHAMRMNNSISCEHIDFAEIPSVCPGPNAFTARFEANMDLREPKPDQPFDYDLKVCVPGSFIESPWTRSRDAETISEEVFFGMHVGEEAASIIDTSFAGSFGFHCTVNSTRGYFELPNAFNSLMPSALLERFPRGKDSERFDDFEESSQRTPPYMRPTDEFDWSEEVLLDYDAPYSYWPDVNITALTADNVHAYMRAYFRAPGPLAISSVALFGNESFFAASKRASALNTTAALESMCQGYRWPFGVNTNLNQFGAHGTQCPDLMEDGLASAASTVANPGWTVTEELLNWFQNFGSGPDDAYALAALQFATFYASDALLTQAASADEEGRTIYASDGRPTQRPIMALPSLIILSVLLAVETYLLLRIAYYAWRTPTWTSTFKALTVAQLANAMKANSLPPAGCHDEEKLKILRRLDGRIGVAVRPDGDGKPEVRQLVYGGSEPLLPANITRLRKRRVFSLQRRATKQRRDGPRDQRLLADSAEEGRARMSGEKVDRISDR